MLEVINRKKVVKLTINTYLPISPYPSYLGLILRSEAPHNVSHSRGKNVIVLTVHVHGQRLYIWVIYINTELLNAGAGPVHKEQGHVPHSNSRFTRNMSSFV